MNKISVNFLFKLSIVSSTVFWPLRTLCQSLSCEVLLTSSNDFQKEYTVLLKDNNITLHMTAYLSDVSN